VSDGEALLRRARLRTPKARMEIGLCCVSAQRHGFWVPSCWSAAADPDMRYAPCRELPPTMWASPSAFCRKRLASRARSTGRPRNWCTSGFFRRSRRKVRHPDSRAARWKLPSMHVRSEFWDIRCRTSAGPPAATCSGASASRSARPKAPRSKPDSRYNRQPRLLALCASGVHRRCFQYQYCCCSSKQRSSCM
jgi:hypothetical protein